MAIPGFDLGPSDAKEAGEGATVHEGRLIATVVGRIEETENVVSVLSMNPITRPKKDDIVIGEVVKLNEKNGEIRLIGIEGTPRQDFLPQDLHAQFFITDLCEKYFHNMSDGVKVRDIVRAKVTEDALVIKVEMKSADELGVLWALCPSCGMTLQTQKSQDWNMVCTACKRTSFRAIADDYGNGENLATLNNAGKRWGKEAETLFSKGASGRSTIIAADVREDGRERTFFRFEGDQGGRSSRQKAPKGCRLFVGGLPRSIDTEKLQSIFAPHGDITDAIVITDPAGVSKGFGFVTYEKKEQAEAAIKALDQSSLEGRKIGVRDADDSSKGKSSSRPRGSRFYTGNLSFKSTEEDLKTLFSSYGTVSRVDYPKDPSGHAKGFAFVTMEGDVDKDKIIAELHQKEFMGRKIKVDKAQSSTRSRNRGNNDQSSKKSARELRAIREENASPKKRQKR